VARGARIRRGGATVRLVAACAVLVPLGRGSVDVGVTALALLLQGAGVGLVTRLAIAMAFVHFAVFLLMASLTLHLQSLGPMRQPPVTVGAGRVSLERSGVLGILGVALDAERDALGR